MSRNNNTYRYSMSGNLANVALEIKVIMLFCSNLEQSSNIGVRFTRPCQFYANFFPRAFPLGIGKSPGTKLNFMCLTSHNCYNIFFHAFSPCSLSD